MKICSPPSLVCLMVLSISGNVVLLMNDNLQFQFAMYNPVTDTIEVTAASGSVLVIRCREFNASDALENPEDIVYLYRLAEEQPLTYAKFALSDTGLQDYVNAMNWFN